MYLAKRVCVVLAVGIGIVPVACTSGDGPGFHTEDVTQAGCAKVAVFSGCTAAAQAQMPSKGVVSAANCAAFLGTNVFQRNKGAAGNADAKGGNNAWPLCLGLWEVLEKPPTNCNIFHATNPANGALTQCENQFLMACATLNPPAAGFSPLWLAKPDDFPKIRPNKPSPASDAEACYYLNKTGKWPCKADGTLYRLRLEADQVAASGDLDGGASVLPDTCSLDTSGACAGSCDTSNVSSVDGGAAVDLVVTDGCADDYGTSGQVVTDGQGYCCGAC